MSDMPGIMPGIMPCIPCIWYIMCPGICGYPGYMTICGAAGGAAGFLNDGTNSAALALREKALALGLSLDLDGSAGAASALCAAGFSARFSAC